MNIFITGGTSGIGLALAQYYLARGHRVGVCGRNLEKLSYRHPQLFSYQVDVLDLQALKDAVESFASEELDMMVASAGLSLGGEKKALPNFQAARDIVSINVLGVINAFQAAFEIMKPQGRGQVVALSSLAGFIGLPGAGSYCASKAAVMKLCEAYSIDWKAFGITVTCLCPGFVDTPLTAANQHAMPLLMDVEVAAQKMAQAIAKKKKLYLLPWPTATLVSLMALIPRSWYRWMMSYYPLKNQE